MNPQSEIRNPKYDDAVEALQNMAVSTAPGAPPESPVDEKDYSLSQFSQLWMAGQEGALAGRDLNVPLEPYQQVLWAYKCITALAKTASGIPLRFSAAGNGVKYNRKSYAAQIRRSTQRTLRPVRGCRAACLGRAAEGELVETGEAYDLFDRPNSYQDWPQFFFAHVGYLMARGKVAWVLTGMEGRGRRPAEFHVVDGRHIKPVWSRDEQNMPLLDGYKYRAPKTGREIPLATDEVKYWALWDDSDDPLGGMAPHAPGRLAIATDYNASLYNAHVLTNGCETGLKITFPGSLTDEQRDQFRTALLERHQGPANAHRPLILEGGATADSLGAVLRDMEWDKLKRTTRLELCALYDVPPVVAGWVDAAGDSSAYTENALKQFYQQAIFPLLDGTAPAIQEIVSRFDARMVAWFDVEDQPVVQQMRTSRIAAAKDLFAMARPWADINDLLDLGMPVRPWDETGFVTVNLVPAEQAATGYPMPPLDEPVASSQESVASKTVAGSREPGAGEKQEEEPATTPSKAALDNLWQLWQRSWTPLAQRFAAMLRNHYGAQERQLVKLVREYLNEELEVRGSKFEAKSTVDTGLKPVPRTPNSELRTSSTSNKSEIVIARILMEVFDDGEAKLQFNARVQRFAIDGGELGIRQSIAEAGYGGDEAGSMAQSLLANPRITQAARTEALVISTKINAYTRRHLRASLNAGLESGESALQLADRVGEFLQGRRSAALTTSRNYVGQVLSRARRDGRLAAGVTHEVWIHSRGAGERRPAHVEAEGRYVKSPKPIGSPFIVNGESLRYPRDPAGSPGEIINCQCLAIGKRISKARSSEFDVRSEESEHQTSNSELRTSNFFTYAEMLNHRDAEEEKDE